MDVSTTPFRILAGANNPFVLGGLIPANSVVASSDSVVPIPIYNGGTLCPGASCPETIVVDIVGFLEIFIKEEADPDATVWVYIRNVAGCAGSGGGSGGTTIMTGGGSPIPVRLIHQ